MADNEHLHSQLIKLGDMMGDGLHHEPGGAWIEKEYKKVARALGYLKPKKRDVEAINVHMKRRVTDVPCQKCRGELKQTRSGSKRAQCVACGAKFQLLK